MRLLHLDKAGKLVRTDFRGKAIPQYAILSHRWGKDEVVFEDLAGDKYESKSGYIKIKFCVKQTAEDQLRYFWIDTCCIDKWKTEELSNAVNSMFSWYKRAAKCYVLLPDVLVPIATDVHQQSLWEASFRRSEWFTRGWTLQELVAPESLEFFTWEGHRLGSKTSLEQLVHEITGIPTQVLQGCPLEIFEPQDRIKWAENRRTTEPEDSAYCLFGILGVRMQTTYGEGKENAMARLHSELRATSTPFIVPYCQNTQFVGREPQLEELEAKVFGDRQTTRIAIVGAGGTGKSQLALELAYRTKRKTDNDFSVFWIDARDFDSVLQNFSNIAQKLNIEGWDDEKIDVKQLVKCHLESSTRKHLLIFDNVDDLKLRSPGLSSPQTVDLIDFIPLSGLGTTVFTTTDINVANALAVGSTVTLQGLTPDSARLMVENSIKPTLQASDVLEVRLLLEYLSYLPLAIVQAAAYINTTGATLKEYQSQLVQQQGFLEPSGQSSDPNAQESEQRDAVATTLLVSMDHICRNYPQTACYLFHAACMDQKDIPLDVLVAESSDKRNNVIRDLSAYALVIRRPADSAFDIHRLVHAALRKLLAKLKLLSKWTQIAMKRLLVVFPDDDARNRSKWRRLLPHAKYALSHVPSEPSDEDRTDLAWKCARAMYQDGRYGESEELFTRVVQIRKMRLGTEHSNTLRVMSDLAATYRHLGWWNKAEQLQIQVVEARKTKLGTDHHVTLSSMSNLAETYRVQSQWQQAEKLCVQVMEGYQRTRGLSDPSTMAATNTLALIYKSQGRWAEAQKIFAQLMKMYMDTIGIEDPEPLATASNLAATCRSGGWLKGAEQFDLHVVQTQKKTLGADHPKTLVSIGNLALTYENLGRWQEAEQLQMQVLVAFETKLGPGHPHTLNSMNNLAVTYRNRNRYTEAERLQLKVMETYKTKLGDDHLETLASMHNLASTYRDQRRYVKAMQLEATVMEARKKMLGADHPDTLATMNNLAHTLKDLGRVDEAVELMSDCVQRRNSVQGAAHFQSVWSYNALVKWKAEQLRATSDTPGDR